MTTWTYIGAAATAERRAALESPRPFVELLTPLKRTMKFACFHREPKQRDDSYARADFCIDVGHSLFDALFNAATGYRGAYFDSPEIGVAANHRLIAELAPILVTWALTEHPELDRPWVEESLSLPTAKAWLAEDAAALCPACAGGWSASYVSDLQIANGRWERSAHTHAKWGRQAPGLSKLRVFGAFVNKAHREWVADHKQARAEHIWEHGWT